jgi:anti-sigma-K factor RskA
MTAADDSLLDLAVPYALHALTDAERDGIDSRLADSGADARVFYDEVLAVREAMAAASAATAAEPPAALRARVLAATRDANRAPDWRWRATVLAAAAAAAIGLGVAGVGIALRSETKPSTEQQIFAAPDVRTVGGTLPTGGTATLVFSRDEHAGVLVMNNVPPPSEGTVYQMWLIGSGSGATSAGTMDAAAVAPPTTAVLLELGDSTELAFTVEPGTGSTQPTGEVFARLALT